MNALGEQKEMNTARLKHLQQDQMAAGIETRVTSGLS